MFILVNRHAIAERPGADETFKTEFEQRVLLNEGAHAAFNAIVSQELWATFGFTLTSGETQMVIRGADVHEAFSDMMSIVFAEDLGVSLQELMSATAERYALSKALAVRGIQQFSNEYPGHREKLGREWTLEGTGGFAKLVALASEESEVSQALKSSIEESYRSLLVDIIEQMKQP